MPIPAEALELESRSIALPETHATHRVVALDWLDRLVGVGRCL
jgi:hypothetical protein